MFVNIETPKSLNLCFKKNHFKKKRHFYFGNSSTKDFRALSEFSISTYISAGFNPSFHSMNKRFSLLRTSFLFGLGTCPNLFPHEKIETFFICRHSSLPHQNLCLANFLFFPFFSIESFVVFFSIPKNWNLRKGKKKKINKLSSAKTFFLPHCEGFTQVFSVVFLSDMRVDPVEWRSKNSAFSSRLPRRPRHHEISLVSGEINFHFLSCFRKMPG